MRLTLAALVATAMASNDFGKKFLEKKKQEADVVALPSGLMYKVIREGDGEAHPLKDTQCSCHYEGRTAQEYSKSPKGKKFDSSYDRGDPTSFAPSGVIAGWTEAMQLMVEGDKWEMYIPSELGYGDGGQGGDIGPGDVLVFTMEILKIEGPSRPSERGPPPFTDYSADVDGFKARKTLPPVLAVLRQPIAAAKVFGAFKAAARAMVKSGAATALDFALTAASKFEKGKYTVDAIAAELKLSAPTIYVDAGEGYKKCAVGRPTETELSAMAEAIKGCAQKAFSGRQGKAEL